MSGINFSVTVNDQEVRQALGTLIERGESLRPALMEIGEHLIEVHHERFAAQTGPDGQPWKPLSPKYQARKKRHQNMILVLNQHLADSWRYQAGQNSLEFGTDRVYAAVHHFGFPQKNIPARPFLGITEGDEEPVNIIAEYLMDTQR